MDASDGILAAEAAPDPLVSARALAPRLLLQFEEYRWLLAGIDLLAVNGALLVSLSLRSGIWVRWRILADHPLWFMLMSALWLLFANVFDAYDLGVADRLFASVRAVVKAGVLAVLIYLFIPFFTPPLPPSHLALLSLPSLVVAALLGDRALCALAVRTPVFRRRVLIIGTGQSALTVARVLSNEGRSSYRIVGFVSEHPENSEVTIELDGQEARVEGAQKTLIRLPVLGDPRATTGAAARYGITTLVLATPDTRESSLLQFLADCAERGIEVTPASCSMNNCAGEFP